MNKYAAIFFGFIAIVIVAYFITTRNVNSNATVSELASSGKQDVVVKKYTAEEKARVLETKGGDFYMGKEHAPVTIIEYASLGCPHCAAFHEKVVEGLIPAYVETGKVKYVYRHFPGNGPALEAAKIATCAGKERFFSFIKVFFQTQGNWIFNSSELKNIAKMGGIDEASYAKCLADKSIEQGILQTYKDASDILGVEHTPTVFINGTEYTGKHLFADVAEVVEKQLKGNEK